MFKKLAQWLSPNERNRHAWIEAKLKSLPPGLKLLDAGAGQQPFRAQCAHLQYFAQDFGVYAPEGEGLQIKAWQYGELNYQGDVWNIQEQDAFFDVVLCTEVLEHVPYPNETLREFSRLLKPGGTLLLTAPFASLPHMRPHYYYSGFSREYYETQLAQHGFDVQEITANGNFFLYLAQESVRGLRIVRNPLGKLLYAVVFALPVLCLRWLAWAAPDPQLVFGYHVRAMKRRGETNPGRPN